MAYAHSSHRRRSSVPGSAPRIAAAIDDLSHHRSDLRRLLLTHYHEDHIGSAAGIVAWGGVTVYAHRADAPVIRGDVAGLPPKLLGWEQPLFDQVRAQMPTHPPAPANVDPAQAVTSFKRQAWLDVDVACFGHGEPLTGSAPGPCSGRQLRDCLSSMCRSSPWRQSASHRGLPLDVRLDCAETQSRLTTRLRRAHVPSSLISSLAPDFKIVTKPRSAENATMPSACARR